MLARIHVSVFHFLGLSVEPVCVISYTSDQSLSFVKVCSIVQAIINMSENGKREWEAVVIHYTCTCSLRHKGTHPRTAMYILEQTS